MAMRTGKPLSRCRYCHSEGLDLGSGSRRVERHNMAIGTGNDESANQITELLREPAGDTMRGMTHDVPSNLIGGKT